MQLRRITTTICLAGALLGGCGHAGGAEGGTTDGVPGQSPAQPVKDPGPPPGTPPSEKDIDALNYDDSSDDNDFVTPFAHNFNSITASKERVEEWDLFKDKLEDWAPGKVKDLTQRARNLISLVALMDLGEGNFESETPLLIYNRLVEQIPKDQIVGIMAELVFHPGSGTVVETAPEFDLRLGVGAAEVRERVGMYAKKMLGRLKGKLPVN